MALLLVATVRTLRIDHWETVMIRPRAVFLPGRGFMLSVCEPLLMWLYVDVVEYISFSRCRNKPFGRKRVKLV